LSITSESYKKNALAARSFFAFIGRAACPVVKIFENENLWKMLFDNLVKKLQKIVAITKGVWYILERSIVILTKNLLRRPRKPHKIQQGGILRMKKTNMLLRILLVLALVVGLCVVAAVADETTKIHCECGKTASGICQICGTEAVEWTPITNPGQMSSGGHYYLTEDVTTSNDTDGANWRLAGQY